MMTTLEVVFAVRELVDDRLSGRHKNVLFALASHRGVNGVISASSAQLSKATAESRATIYRALDDLVTWGYVLRSPRGRYTAPTYELVLPERASHGENSQGENSHPETTTSHGETTTSHGETTTSHGETFWGSSADLSEDLLADPSGRRPASAANDDRPLELVHPTPRTDGHGKVIATFRQAYRERYGIDPNTRRPRTGRAAKDLLEAVRGDVERACETVRIGVATGERELHHIASDANKYLPEAQRRPARAVLGGQRGLAVECLELLP